MYLVLFLFWLLLNGKLTAEVVGLGLVITALMGASKDCAGAQVVISHCENLTGAMKLKEQILADLPVKSVDVIPCRGLTSFYAMEKGLIIGY